MDRSPTIAVLGGTGTLGTGLSLRWAKAGYPLVIGSRSATGAEAAAAAIQHQIPGADIRGLENRAAAAAADIVVLTVPYAGHRALLETIAENVRGKIVVDATVPLVPPKVSTVQLPPGCSVGKATQDFLGDGVRVVSAFQNVAAHRLQHPDEAIDCDVLVSGNDADAREVVIGLANALGLRAWHAGPIANSAAAEALTSVLIAINRRYKIDGAGLRITGAPAAGG